MFPLKSLLPAVCAFVYAAQVLVSGAAQAHEFLIEPQAYQIAPGETALAAFHVGQDFKGPTFIYVPRRSVRFEQVAGGAQAEVAATVGDNPAFQLTGAPEGLLIVAHEAAAQTLAYKTWDKFQKFIDHKDFGNVLSAHTARGLPTENFRESYSRYAKALIGVGDGAGTDRVFGLRTEIIAQANPYTDDLSNGLPVLVMLEGEPRTNAQVELFEKAPDGTVTITLHRTNNDGIAVLPVRAEHSYLADAVTLQPRDPAEAPGVAYHSLWAALTFAVP